MNLKVILLICLCILKIDCHSANHWGDARVGYTHIPVKDIDNLNWENVVRWDISNELFEPLVSYKGFYDLNSESVANWKISKDRTIYELNLRNDLRFSNGRKITTDDVIFSLKRYLIKENDTNIFKKAIKGAVGHKDINKEMEGLEKIDKLRFKIILNHPFELLWSFLSKSAIAGIVAKETIDPKTLKMITPSVSSGPMVIYKHTKDHIFFKLNPYHRNTPKSEIKSVAYYKVGTTNKDILKAFNAGKINFFFNLYPFSFPKVNPKMVTRQISTKFSRFHHFILNDKTLNRNNRYAIAETFNKCLMEKYSMKGAKLIWSNSIFSPHTPGSSYEKCIKKITKNNIRVNGKKTIRFISYTKVMNDHVKFFFKERLNAIGLVPEFKVFTLQEYDKHFFSNNFDIAYQSIGFSHAEYETGLHDYFGLNEPILRDLSGSVLKLVFKNSQEKNISKRIENLKKIDLAIKKDAVVLPIYHAAETVYLGKNLTIDPKDTHSNIIRWHKYKIMKNNQTQTKHNKKKI